MEEIKVKDIKHVFKKKPKQTFLSLNYKKKKKNVELLNSISCDVHLP